MSVLALMFALLLGAAQTTPAAQPGPILTLADARDLAEVLAEATAVQDICYGWSVNVVDQSDYLKSGTDIGSSRGVGVAATQCPRWIVFEADLTYTSESSEMEDSGTFDVRSNVANAPTKSDLTRTGISIRQLLGDRDDLTVINAASALPLLAADRGVAPPLALEPNTDPLPESDRATGTPGSDWLRTNWQMLTFGFVLTLVGAGVAAVAFLQPRSDRPQGGNVPW